MKEIVRVLLREGIDTETIHRVLDTIEEEYDIISEVSMAKWKKAAQNSIEGRKNAEMNAENDADFVTSHSWSQGPLDYGKPIMYSKSDVNKANDNVMKSYDRTARAKKLAQELPNSNANASKVFKAARKVVKSRTANTDKAHSDVKNAYEKDDNSIEGSNKFYKEVNKRARAIGKEDQARVLANKPLRHINRYKDGYPIEVGNGNYFRSSGGVAPAHKSSKKEN